MKTYVNKKAAAKHKFCDVQVVTFKNTFSQKFHVAPKTRFGLHGLILKIAQTPLHQTQTNESQSSNLMYFQDTKSPCGLPGLTNTGAWHFTLEIQRSTYPDNLSWIVPGGT